MCKIDSAHRQTRLTGTDRFTFEAIGETAYRISKGTLTTGEMIIPAYYRLDADSEYLPVTEIGNSSDSNNSNGAFYSTDITSVSTGAFSFWTASQTINVLGHASQAAADAAWGTGTYNWRYHCRAAINYLGR